jgi:hypothetical protein
MEYISAHSVLWNKVGLNGEEALLIKEDSETRLFTITGQTGVALWSRVASGTTFKGLVEEMAQVFDLSVQDAVQIVEPFLKRLLELELVTSRSNGPFLKNGLKTATIVEYPIKIDAFAIEPLELEALVDEDLVALGSFQGGQNNIGGNPTCKSGIGGKNNFGGNGPCRKGTGYGFNNAGWSDSPCDY